MPTVAKGMFIPLVIPYSIIRPHCMADVAVALAERLAKLDANNHVIGKMLNNLKQGKCQNASMANWLQIAQVYCCITKMVIIYSSRFNILYWAYIEPLSRHSTHSKSFAWFSQTI